MVASRIRIRPGPDLLISMKPATFSLLVSLALLLTSGCKEPLPRVADPVQTPGTPAPGRILLGSGATPVERTAAEQLAKHLTEITGREFPIVQSADGGPVFAVGPGAARQVAPDIDLSWDNLLNDGIVMKTVDGSVVLTGADDAKRGTLYAVQEFLEEVAGVRWWTPTVTHIPTNPELRIPELDVRYTPEIRYREVFTNAISPKAWTTAKEPLVAEFAVRMRLNMGFYRIPDSWGGFSPIDPWSHSFFKFLPPDRYFKDHPEWYSEIDGVRKWQRAQLCMSNDEMLEELAKNVAAYLRQRPNVGVVAVDQEDWHGNCQCAKCTALDEKHGSPAASLLYGVNRVAERIESEFPHVLVTTLAYLYSRKPPTDYRARQNVMIRLAVIERNPFQPITHPANAKVMADLEGWRKAADNLALWDYSANLYNPMIAEPRFAVFGPDIRTYRDFGARSIFFEASHGYSPVTDFDELNTYLSAKLMWKPDQDDRALRDEFLAGYYGAAAPSLAAYLDLLLSAAEKAGPRVLSHGETNSDWMSLAEMNRATELMESALAAVAGEPELTRRVQRPLLGLLHQWALRYSEYRKASEEEGIPFLGPPTLAEALSKLRSIAETHGIKYGGFIEPNRKSLDVIISQLERSGSSPSAGFLLKEDPVYMARLAGDMPPLPGWLEVPDPSKVIQVHEDRLAVAIGETILDPKASDHAALSLTIGSEQWGAQVRNPPGIGIKGRHRVYADVRIDSSAHDGGVLIGGVRQNDKSLAALNVTHSLPELGRNRPARPGADFRDGEYHLYDLGVHDLTESHSIWIGNPKLDPLKVRGIYVDRFLFVPEN